MLHKTAACTTRVALITASRPQERKLKDTKVVCGAKVSRVRKFHGTKVLRTFAPEERKFHRSESSIAANPSAFGGIFLHFIVVFRLSECNHAFPLFNTVTKASFYLFSLLDGLCCLRMEHVLRLADGCKQEYSGPWHAVLQVCCYRVGICVCGINKSFDV